LITLAFPARAEALWSCSTPGLPRPLAVAAPVVRLDDTDLFLSSAALGASERQPVTIAPGLVERRWSAPVDSRPDLTLELVARIAADTPFVRFRYVLHASAPVRLTNDDQGRNALAYFRVSLAEHPRATEVRLSSYLKPVHSFVPEEVAIPPAHFDAGLSIMGPILAATDGTTSLVLAYEHGSQSPNRFLEFRLAPDRSVTLAAVKGNYFHGRVLGPGAPFETLWFQLGAVAGDETALAAAYRHFVLRRLSPNPESRKPYVFYNTWNHQERLKHWHKRPYLAEMTQERMLAEIDVASRMGVDVFVIDTGWYGKTGDWRVDRSRFPDDLAAVRAALAARGMKLGLWFNPTIAALTSEMHAAHRDCIQEWRGVPHAPHAHWEGEPSQGLCLVSRYADAYADELVRLVRELGVTYFKWDAIGQEGPYSCDAPGHDHGGPENSPEERNACYGFEQVRAMARVVDRVCAACPEAIFDFDVTEPGRSVGLAFLAAGKYFLVNNGPYHWEYDLPATTDGNANLFFFPGPARAWICRAPLAYDKWIPSVLFLTHYLPDAPEDSQLINAASLMLGQNGVWGDLLSLDPASIARWRRLLDLYKQVRDSVTAASPVRTGPVGGDPEVHEKIAPDGRGLVAIFASSAGAYDYLTHATRLAPAHAATPDVEIVRLLPDGRAHLRATFTAPGARLVFFGAA
jgi:alpha-galactosidase